MTPRPRLPWLLALLVFAPFALNGCRRSFESCYEKAQKEFAEKNYIDTIDDLNMGLPAWRESDGVEKKAQALQMLGHAYHRVRNTEKAIKAYQEATRLSNSTYESANELGMLWVAKGQIEAAHAAFRDALVKKPNDPQALLGLGNTLYLMKRYSEARAAYQGVIDNSPAVREAMEALRLLDQRDAALAPPRRHR